MKTVLLVDDAPDTLAAVAELLEAAGYHVLPAANAAEALAFAGTVRIDAAVIDVAMPEMDGTQLATRLRARLPDTRLVLYSGYAQFARFADLKGTIGADVWLQKPFIMSNLVAAIEGESEGAGDG